MTARRLLKQQEKDREDKIEKLFEMLGHLPVEPRSRGFDNHFDKKLKREELYGKQKTQRQGR